MRSLVGKISILIVDDHAGVREGIRAVIENQPDMTVVGEASNGVEAIQEFKRLLPNITLADVTLPVICGLEAVALIRREFPQARFIVISALNDTELVEKAFAAGAQAFLHKDMLRRELLSAIRAVYSGQHYVPGTNPKSREEKQ
jgi:two-component system, NarL family, response regulator